MDEAKEIEIRQWLTKAAHDLDAARRMLEGDEPLLDIAASVSWGGTHSWKLIFNVSKETAQDLKTSQWEFQRYDTEFHSAVIRPLEPAKIDLSGIEYLFDAAYGNIVGTK